MLWNTLVAQRPKLIKGVISKYNSQSIVTNRGVISKYNWQSIINLAALHASSDTCTYTAAGDTQIYTEQ